MNSKRVFGFLISVLSVSAFAAGAKAYAPDHNYPNYAKCERVKSATGLVTVCPLEGNNPGLHIQYDGPLVTKENPSDYHEPMKTVGVWLRLDGKEAYFKMDNLPYPGTFGQMRYAELILTPAYVTGSCRWSSTSGDVCVRAPAQVRDLFTGRSPSRLESFPLEIAIVHEETNRWDNNGGYGVNFRFGKK